MKSSQIFSFFSFSMLHRYQRKTTKGNITPEQLHKALQTVESGLSFREAGEKFGVPKSTVFKYCKKPMDQVSIRLGTKTVIPPLIEEELVHYALEISQRFFGITHRELRELAFEIITRHGCKHPFNKEKRLAGKDWYYGFISRHPQLALRSPEATNLARATGFNKVAVQQFLDGVPHVAVDVEIIELPTAQVDEARNCLSPFEIAPMPRIPPRKTGQRKCKVSVILTGNVMLATEDEEQKKCHTQENPVTNIVPLQPRKGKQITANSLQSMPPTKLKKIISQTSRSCLHAPVAEKREAC